MKDIVKDLVFGMPWYCYVTLFVVMGLIITAFFLPPVSIIDKSVLYAASILLGSNWVMFVTINIPTFIEKGAKIRAQWGNKTIEIGKENNFENNDNDGLSENQQMG